VLMLSLYVITRYTRYRTLSVSRRVVSWMSLMDVVASKANFALRYRTCSANSVGYSIGCLYLLSSFIRP